MMDLYTYANNKSGQKLCCGLAINTQDDRVERGRSTMNTINFKHQATCKDCVHYEKPLYFECVLNNPEFDSCFLLRTKKRRKGK